MHIADRILNIAAQCVQLQARLVARKASRLMTLVLLKVAAGILALTALGVLLVAMYVALAMVVHAAVALAIVGVVLALAAVIIILFALAIERRAA